MRKKFVVALVVAMSLTVAGTGTVFAMDKVSAIASEKEHVHGDNCEWVVDKEAWQETIHHEAEYKTVHHEAEGYYEKQQVQVGTKPIYEKQKHAICQTCGGIDIGLYEDPVEGGLSKEYGEHIGYHADRGEFRITIKAKWVDVQVGEEPVYEEKDIWIETKPAWDEQVLVKEAYDEVINHPEEDIGYVMENHKSRIRNRNSRRIRIKSQNSRRTQIKSRNSQRTQIRNRNSQRIQM